MPFYLHPRAPLPTRQQAYEGYTWLSGSPWGFGVETYLRENFYITTSGNFHTPALTNVMLEVGADRVLYSVDYPFEDRIEAKDWFDQASISDSDRMQIASGNAQKLFHL